jgi:hypothetical protein
MSQIENHNTTNLSRHSVLYQTDFAAFRMWHGQERRSSPRYFPAQK